MSQTKRMIKHSSIYAIGNISRQIVGFIMLPVYTRYLTPADYGVVGLLIFMVSLIELVFGARLFQAVPKFYYEQDDRAQGHSVISTALLITSAVSILTVLAVVYFRQPISNVIFGSVQYGYLVGLFAVLILTQALENYTLGYLRILQRPWLFIGASMSKLVLQLSMNITLVVVMELGVLGVALSNVISSVVFTGAMTLYTLWHTGVQYSSSIAKKMLWFSWPLWLSGLAGLYMGSSNRYFIRIFGSLDEVGLFELAAKFGTMITVLVWIPFSQYWQTERFNLYRKSDPIPIYQSVFKLISLVLMLVGLGMGLFASPVIRIMADAKFHSAAEAVPYLVFGAIFHCLTFFTSFSFLVTEKTSWITYNAYVTAVIISGFYFLLIPRFGFVGAAQALMIANILQFLIAHFLAKRSYDMRLSLRPLALYSLAYLIATVTISNLDLDGVIAEMAAITAVYGVSCVVMVAYFLITGNFRGYVVSLIKNQWLRMRGVIRTSER